jgi:hypothetical protein
MSIRLANINVDSTVEGERFVPATGGHFLEFYGALLTLPAVSYGA